MPTKKNSNDNDKGRRRSGGGSRSRQHRGQSKTNVGKVVDQLDDMIFGCNPMRLCDDKDPRALKGCLSDERYTNGEAAELVRDRLKEAFVQDIDHADGLPSDTLSDLLSEDETNEILIDDTLTLDTCSSIGSIEKVEKVPAPLPPEPSQLAPDGPTRSFFESETPRIGSRRSSAKTFATENEPVVRETAAPEEERSVLNNRQITGEGNTAKVEVDDSCKKNEVTETGLEMQAPPAPPCDNRDDDKDELGLIVANTSSAPVEDEPTVTKSTVAAAVLVAPKNSRDEVVAPDGISELKEIVSPTIEPVVRETAAPEEEGSILNNRQIEGNMAKVEVDDSCKKNEATETGLNIQAPPAPPCDGKDDDKDELDLIVKNATDSIEDNATPEEDEPTVTTSTVAAAILVAPEVKKRTNGGIAKRAAALAATPEAKKAENSSPGTQSKAKTGAVIAGGAAAGAYLFHKHREEKNDASSSSSTAAAPSDTANSSSTNPSSGRTKSKSGLLFLGVGAGLAAAAGGVAAASKRKSADADSNRSTTWISKDADGCWSDDVSKSTKSTRHKTRWSNQSTKPSKSGRKAFLLFGAGAAAVAAIRSRQGRKNAIDNARELTAQERIVAANKQADGDSADSKGSRFGLGRRSLAGFRYKVTVDEPPAASEAAFVGPPRYDWIDIETAAAVKVQAAWRRYNTIKDLQRQDLYTVGMRNRGRAHRGALLYDHEYNTDGTGCLDACDIKCGYDCGLDGYGFGTRRGMQNDDVPDFMACCGVGNLL